MRRGVLVVLMLLLAMPVYAVSIPMAGDSDVKFDIGGDVRLRYYDFENFWDFDDHNRADDFRTFRLRTRIYTKASLTDNVTGYVRLANQTYGQGKGLDGKGKNMDDTVFVDNAYIDIQNFFGLPMSLRVGRQNLMYGTGFVLFDGESEAASTAIFFDAVKLSWKFSDKLKLDAIYANDEENNRAENPSDDIILSGGYLTANCPVMGGQQELYALNRVDRGIDKDIWMYGARLSNKYDCGLDYSVEYAIQRGDAFRDASGTLLDQEARGCKLELGYKLPIESDCFSVRPFIGYVLLSGDKAHMDNEFEGWDVFYGGWPQIGTGGWPQFGDLLAWTSVNLGATPLTTLSPNYEQAGSVTGEANYSNLRIASIGAQIGYKKLKADLVYSQLKLDEKDTASATVVSFENDDDYGDYYQLQLSYPYTKAVTFSMYLGVIEPGDAFPDTNDDTAHELFFETNLAF